MILLFLRDSPSMPHLLRVEWIASKEFTLTFMGGSTTNIPTTTCHDEAVARMMADFMPDSSVVRLFDTTTHVTLTGFDMVQHLKLRLYDNTSVAFNEEMERCEAAGRGKMPRVVRHTDSWHITLK